MRTARKGHDCGGHEFFEKLAVHQVLPVQVQQTLEVDARYLSSDARKHSSTLLPEAFLFAF